jgi:hypothetical protein
MIRQADLSRGYLVYRPLCYNKARHKQTDPGRRLFK